MAKVILTDNGGIVGIIRVELMLIKKLHKIDRNIKFSAKSKYGFREVGEHELKWIFDCRSIEESYSKYKRRSNKKFIKIGRNPILSMRHYLDRKKYKKSGLVYPYKDGDIVYSCGWFGSGKEGEENFVGDSEIIALGGASNETKDRPLG